jgi:hypothetical protein
VSHSAGAKMNSRCWKVSGCRLHTCHHDLQHASLWLLFIDTEGNEEMNISHKSCKHGGVEWYFLFRDWKVQLSGLWTVNLRVEEFCTVVLRNLTLFLACSVFSAMCQVYSVGESYVARF